MKKKYKILPLILVVAMCMSYAQPATVTATSVTVHDVLVSASSVAKKMRKDGTIKRASKASQKSSSLKELLTRKDKRSDCTDYISFSLQEAGLLKRGTTFSTTPKGGYKTVKGDSAKVKKLFTETYKCVYKTKPQSQYNTKEEWKAFKKKSQVQYLYKKGVLKKGDMILYGEYKKVNGKYVLKHSHCMFYYDNQGTQTDPDLRFFTSFRTGDIITPNLSDVNKKFQGVGSGNGGWIVAKVYRLNK